MSPTDKSLVSEILTVVDVCDVPVVIALVNCLLPPSKERIKTSSDCGASPAVELAYTELTLNIENETNYIQSACDADGRIGSRVVSQTVTCTVNPYLQSDDLTDTWDKFNDNDDVSLFAYAYNSSSTAGEFGETVAIWIPQAKITAAPVSDVDGIVAEALEMKAHRNLGGDSIFLGFI